MLSLPCGIKPIAYIGGILPDFLHLREERLNPKHINNIGCQCLKKGIKHHIEIDKFFHQNILPKYQSLIQELWASRHKTFPRRRYFFFHSVTEVILDLLLLDIAYWEVSRKLFRIDTTVLNSAKSILISIGISLRNVENFFKFMQSKWILRLSFDHVIFIVKRREGMWGVLPESWQQTLIIAKEVLKKDVKTFYEWLHDFGFGLWLQLDS